MTVLCLFCMYVVPEAPQLLKTTQLSETSVMLAWKKPDSPGGQILDYQINYFGYLDEESRKV